MIDLKKKYRRWLHGQCAVLLYHRVYDAVTDPQLLAVSPLNFDAHLSHLKRNYNVLTVDEFTGLLLKKHKFPPRSVLITFDDGYADNFHQAMPVLEKHKLQALFYICTGNLNTKNEFWWDEVERHLLLSGDLPESFRFNLQNKESSFETNSKNDYYGVYENLLPLLRAAEVPARDKVLSELTSWSKNNTPRESHRSMTFDELMKMSNSPAVVIGAHTLNHPSLAALKYNEQQNEIVESKKVLSKLTGQEINHFSFPFGTRLDFTAETIEICKDEGFHTAAANYPDSVDIKSDIFRFPRFLVRDWNETEFAVRVKNFFN